MTIIEIVIRTTVAFIILYIMCRILGKKLISQMTFFDFVAAITMGSITASTIFGKDIKLLTALICLILFSLLTLIIDFIALKSIRMRKILNSDATLIINEGNILEKGMKKVRLTVDELLLLLRKKNVFYIDEVEAAIMETNGTLSVLKKTANQPASQKDVNVINTSRGLPQAFIIDGKLLKESLFLLGKDQQWVNQILTERGISNVGEVIFAQIDQQGQIHLYEKGVNPQND